MTLKEALESKKLFKRKHWTEWIKEIAINDAKRLYDNCARLDFFDEQGVIYKSLEIKDILADDYVILSGKRKCSECGAVIEEIEE